MTRKNALYAQSGGVTAVINASACGMLQAALQHSGEIGKVYAGRNGIIGALTEDLIDISIESEAAIAALKYTPGAAMPAIRRLSDAPYRWDIIEAPLSAIANQEKLLPREFISADGFGITADYLPQIATVEAS